MVNVPTNHRVVCALERDSNAKTFLTSSAKMEGGRIVEGMQMVGFRNVAKRA